MTRNDNNPIAPGEHVNDMLSAYIDGTLKPAERDPVRAHLEGCDACRAEHAEILATRSMLRAVPAMQAPRAFTLTPEMARKVRPPSLYERIFRPSNSPGLAVGSVLSFVLLFFVLVIPLFNQVDTTFSRIGYGLSSGDSQYAPTAPEPKQQEDARTMAAQPTATTGAPNQAFIGLPEGTPAPPGEGPPANAGGGQSAIAPTQPAGITAGDTDTTAGAESATTLSEAPANAMQQVTAPEASRQAAPYSPPVDWGAVLMSIIPLFLLGLGVVLALMAWLARRGRPV